MSIVETEIVSDGLVRDWEVMYYCRVTMEDGMRSHQGFERALGESNLWRDIVMWLC